MLDASSQEGEQPVQHPAPHKRRGRRALKIGCLGGLLTLCGLGGALGFALQAGPVTLSLVGGNTLKVGSDSFVLSNYSFQNGTTYFVDLNGNGVRSIVQLHYLSDSHSIELVLHHADKASEGDNQLATMHLP